MITLKKPKAFVDWIDLHVYTERATNLKKMRMIAKAILGRDVYVCGLSEKPNMSCNRFVLRIADPSNALQIIEFEKQLHKEIPLIRQSSHIYGLEIGIDIYESQAAVCSQLYSNLAVKPCEGARVYRFKGEQQKAPKKAETLTNYLENGWQLAIGHKRTAKDQYYFMKGDTVTQHFYYKTFDNRKPLPKSEHRARYEITLHRSAIWENDLPVVLEQLDVNQFKFEQLCARWFTWNLSPERKDKIFNEQVRATFRALSQRWNRRVASETVWCTPLV